MTDDKLLTVSERHRAVFEGLTLDLKIAADGYNALRERSPLEICRTLQGSRKPDSRNLYGAAAAVFCHELYFRHLLPDSAPSSLPEGRHAEMLSNSFGSTGNFFYLARTIAGSTSNPGFLWLYENRRRVGTRLGLARLPLYSLPDLTRARPLMCIDLWEHAYMDSFGTDITGFTDRTLRHTDWNSVFGEITV